MPHEHIPSQATAPDHERIHKSQMPTARFWLLVAGFLAITLLAAWTWSHAADIARANAEANSNVLVGR